MGSSLVKSMGAAYAVSCDKAAGIDIDYVQKSYLFVCGIKNAWNGTSYGCCDCACRLLCIESRSRNRYDAQGKGI